MAAGTCVMTADAVFDQDDDGIVVLTTDQVPGSHEMPCATPSECARRARFASWPIDQFPGGSSIVCHVLSSGALCARSDCV